MEIKVLRNMGNKTFEEIRSKCFHGSVEDGGTSYNGFVSTVYSTSMCPFVNDIQKHNPTSDELNIE